MIGPIGWEEFDDRQTDRRQTDNRQTENSNPSVPYDTFACFAGNIKMRMISIYIPWPFPPVWGVADNTKEQQNNGDFTPFF